jgi:amidase
VSDLISAGKISVLNIAQPLMLINSSIRVPAGFNGLFGLRPSSHRVPYLGSVNSLEGQESLPSVLGPMSTSLSGIKAFMQAVIGKRPWLKDPLSVRKPWVEEEYKLSEHGGGNKLVFGIMWNDGLTVPHPPIIRGMEMTKKALQAAGHEGLSCQLQDDI